LEFGGRLARGLLASLIENRKSGRANREEKIMKKYIALLVLVGLTQSGCAFLGGAATGALATGAAYEISAKRQLDRLEDDYRNERISRREYESRKKQIEAGSIIY
jgi:hypothetical protein